MFVRVKKNGRHEYLQLVSTQRLNGEKREKGSGTFFFSFLFFEIFTDGKLHEFFYLAGQVVGRLPAPFIETPVSHQARLIPPQHAAHVRLNLSLGAGRRDRGTYSLYPPVLHQGFGEDGLLLVLPAVGDLFPSGQRPVLEGDGQLARGLVPGDLRRAGQEEAPVALDVVLLNVCGL